MTTASASKKMGRTAMICAGVAVGMVGVSFAAVPLYSAFCKATGFGGTPMIGTVGADYVLDRKVAVRFDANVSPELAWTFKPEVAEISIKIGETTQVAYTIKNPGIRETTGVATYNVQPELAGAYFTKLQCFCFTEQTLKAGEARTEDVVFYVDPRIVDDPDLKDIKAITLSYTFFPSKQTPPQSASVAGKPKT